MFKNVVRFLNSTGKGVKKMKRLMIALPLFALIGGMVTANAFAATDTVAVSAVVLQGTASLAIKDAATGGADLAAIDFGTVPILPADHRTKQTAPAGGAWVDYFSGGGQFELRAWYDNYPLVNGDPAKTLAGLIKTIGTVNYFWPHKIWCANFGPAGATEGPNPDVNTNWTGDATAVYKWIYERAFKVNGFGDTGLPVGYPAGIYKNETRTTLTWFYPAGTSVRAGTALDARMGSRFRVDVAIDSLDAQYIASTATTYAGTLVFDLEQAP